MGKVVWIQNVLDDSEDLRSGYFKDEESSIEISPVELANSYNRLVSRYDNCGPFCGHTSGCPNG